MDMTIIQQGRFTSTGAGVDLAIRSDVDWMKVINYTAADEDQVAAVGVEYYWQRGMPADGGIEYKKSNAANAANLVVAMDADGFTLVDTTVNAPGGLVALTAISNGNPPVVTTASTAGLSDGDIVRIIDVTGAQQLGGYDFTIDVIDGTTFSLLYGPTIVAGTNGFFRLIPYNPYFYPRNRTISSITQAQQAVVEMTVAHGYTVGQKVRLNIPADFGMVELDGQLATVLGVTAGAILIDIDTTAYTAFSFPLTAEVPFTPAVVVPVGEAAINTLNQPFANLLGDATENVGFIGMHLAAGADSPAGVDDDVIYWVAGKSFSVDND